MRRFGAIATATFVALGFSASAQDAPLPDTIEVVVPFK